MNPPLHENALSNFLESLAQNQGQSSPLAEALRLAAPPQFPPSPSPPIQDRWFKDTTIHIDGYTFERCRFDRCTLLTEFAAFAFRQCFISPDCRLYFAGPSLKVVQLLMHTLRTQDRVQLLPGEEGVCAVLNPDGTFSLE